LGGQRERAVAQAINWISDHYNEPLKIDALARTVHMSASVLHRRFKAVTAMSPLQYQKHV
jgi:AraC-like DNA-binding protein